MITTEYLQDTHVPIQRILSAPFGIRFLYIGPISGETKLAHIQFGTLEDEPKKIKWWDGPDTLVFSNKILTKNGFFGRSVKTVFELKEVRLCKVKTPITNSGSTM